MLIELTLATCLAQGASTPRDQHCEESRVLVGETWQWQRPLSMDALQGLPRIRRTGT